MRYAPLLLALLFLAPAATPAPETNEVISDKEVRPYLEEANKKGNTPSGKRDQLIEYYRAKAYEEGSKREQAIYTYIYAQLLARLQRDAEGADKQYERALKLWPRFPACCVALAEAAVRANDTKTFRTLLKRALKYDREYVNAIVHLGWLALTKNDLDEAELRFIQAIDLEQDGRAFMLLSRVCIERYMRAYDEDDKERFARKSIGVARAWITMEPKNARAHIHVASVLQRLGRFAKAIDSLEESYASADIDEGAKRNCLEILLNFYTGIGDSKKAALTIQRILKMELAADEREHYEERLKDLDKMGDVAFNVWMIEQLLEKLKNDGLSHDDRLSALQNLLRIFDLGRMLTSPHLLELRWRIIKSAFRALINAPPRLAVEMMRFLRKLQDPHLVRILVHFIYPYEDEQRTPQVRLEAVRTLGAVGGVASLPALFFCMSDVRGDIMRAIDQELSRLCEVRSPMGTGIDPLTDEEMRKCRRVWLEYAHSEEGTGKLVEAFAKLGTVVERDPSHTRTLRSAPMVDHAISFVLLDNDMRWEAWKAAYEFLLAYWGRDYRPPEARGHAVRPDERRQITKELREDWMGKKQAVAQPVDPEPEEPKKDKKKKEKK